MLTEFGKIVRKFRIDRGILLGEMAKNIGVSSAYLSSVENGREEISDEHLQRVIKYCSLNDAGATALRESAKGIKK